MSGFKRAYRPNKQPRGVTRLGPTQINLLEMLEEHGAWSPRCGWSWDGEGRTQKRLDRLVEREMVVQRRHVDFDGNTGDVLWYAIATELDGKTARMVCLLVAALLAISTGGENS